jgi:hypothetical protein
MLISLIKLGFTMKRIYVAVFTGLTMMGCTSPMTLDYGSEPTRFGYTEPEASGLIGVRPYPNPDDVCMVIGENALTVELLDDAAILVGCPKHERGAIGDRLRDGGQVVGQAKHWTLISIPTR